MRVQSADLERREQALARTRGELADAETGKREVQDLLRTLDVDRQQSLVAVTEAETALTDAGLELGRADEALTDRKVEETTAAEHREDASEAIRALAVAAYMEPGDDLAWLSDDPDEQLAAGKERALSQTVGDTRVRELHERSDELAAAKEAVRKADEDLTAAARSVEERARS